MDKRYTVNLNAYLYAEDDEAAKIEAAKIAKFLRTYGDNRAQIIDLNENPYGSLNSRQVHKGNLRLFEGKII